MTDKEEKAIKLCSKANDLFNNTERKNTEEQWTLLSEYILCNQSGQFLGESVDSSSLPSGISTPGAKRTQRVFDSTAIQANRDLAAAIHSTLTNPATKWSKIRYKEDDLNNNQEAVAWLQKVNDIIHTSLNESTFDTEISKNYQMFTSLGNMVLMHESSGDEDDGNVKLHFHATHLSEVVWAENHQGKVDTLYRKFKLTAKQAAEKFGIENLSKGLQDKVENKPNEYSLFFHAIYPRPKREVRINEVGRASPKERPFASVYMESTEKHIVEEGGYYEFPCHVVRWELAPGEVYGRGPGSIALPDTRTLNRLKELGLKALNKAVDPMMLANRRDVLGSLDVRPGSLNVMRDINGIRTLDSSARFDVMQFSEQDLRNSIKGIFFLDKLLLPPRTETGEMTATEIQIRTEQMQRVLGPTLGRLNSELLSPLIERTFNILYRAGALPQPPEIIVERGLDVEIVFVNQLARSQQFGDITNIQGWVNELALLAQFKPEVLDNIDADGIASHLAKVRGIPEEAITNQDVVEATRQQRAQQQQMQAMLDSGVQAADISSKL